MEISIPSYDPVVFNIRSFEVHWYGFLYIIGFITGYFLGAYRARNYDWLKFSQKEVFDLMIFIVAGILLGGRLGYSIVYDFGKVVSNPMNLFFIRDGGVSFHGGFIGVLISLAVFSKINKKEFFEVTDFIAPFVPPGILAGRLGNFINGELYGKPTNTNWGVIYEVLGDGTLRHPSQIYELFLEGVLLFLILWLFSCSKKPKMMVSAMFMFCYGIFRCVSEIFREPDVQIGYILFDFITMGMLLSLPMILIGAFLLVIGKNPHS